jgi:hypothetical protein
MHSIRHVLVDRFVSPPVADTGWEDRPRAVWGKGRWSSVGEKVGLERVEGIHDHHASVVLAKSFSPELHRTSTFMVHQYEPPIAHLGLVCEGFHDRLRVVQHRDTIEVNAV